MSDQLAKTGSTLGAITIGGTVIYGWGLLIGAAACIVLLGLAIRFGFRRGRRAGQ